MANKYIIHGATYNGDGTTSAEATSNGGVGAWNNINVFEGTAPTYGSLAAGDTVYIRSKDATGANITVTMAASKTVGSASATSGSYITWILDNGTVWSGVDGVLTYATTGAYSVTFRQYNNFIALSKDALVVKNTSADQGAGYTMTVAYERIVNLKIDWSTKTGTGGCYACDMNGHVVLENTTVTWGHCGTSATDGRGLFRSQLLDGHYTLINPTITITNAGASIFLVGTRERLRVIGGSLSGAGATTGQPLLYVSAASTLSVEIVGFEFPRTMDVTPPSMTSNLYRPATVKIIGCDGGVGGHIEEYFGWATSRTDSNPPTLQASLPDSTATKWSWRVYPKNASSSFPANVQSIKMFTGAAATKTITQEILVANTMSPTATNIWMTVEYIDSATGASKLQTTRVYDGSSLTSSSAAWSASVWGAITFNKYKLSLTTSTSVKQDSIITVTFWSALASGSANDIFFVDPDFSVT